jgi:dipeptide/tripeptide permease
LGIFAAGLVVMGIGTGGFKSNISPLIAEQYKNQKAYVRTRKNGKKEIVDPATTTARIYIYFYMLVNAGSLTGSIAMGLLRALRRVLAQFHAAYNLLSPLPRYLDLLQEDL